MLAILLLVIIVLNDVVSQRFQQKLVHIVEHLNQIRNFCHEFSLQEAAPFEAYQSLALDVLN